MTRWIMISMTLIGLIMAILTRSPGILGLALLMCFVGAFGTIFSIAGERVSANARPDATMLPPEALAAIRDKARARASEQAAAANPQDRATAVARQQ
jgi:disulfide bond formation protein DsbB